MDINFEYSSEYRVCSIQQGKIQETEIYAFSALPGGMKSGKPSVSIISKIGEDKYGIIQVSLEAFLAVAGALKAKYTIDPNAN